MRIRFRGPSGGGFLELAEDATVTQLLSALEAETGSGAGTVAVKFGWPLQTLDVNQGDLAVRQLGLQRENLTVVPVQTLEQQQQQQQQPPATASTSTVTFIAVPQPGEAAATSVDLDAQLAASLSYGSGEDVKVEMPESRTNLVLRVMPDDGDCMFTAVGGALGGLVPLGASSRTDEHTPAALRRLVVGAIRENPVRFDANFLGARPDTYCDRLFSGMWGGGIELSILSEIFRVEICSVDVKTGKAYHFGEQQGFEEFCVVIYSGVHYDRVAETAVEGAMGMVEFDVSRWNAAGNERILRRSQDICQILRDRHYYTSVSDFVVMCNECHEILQGEKAITRHYKVTGHSGVTEIEDAA
ncbi:hypothetical protein F5Y09DRAFT_124248 [Xylaria sp. FL1042]|nr:hypothetical protein F5Y09DRAFT_124248 [Xylaria sp. FL1042]